MSKCGSITNLKSYYYLTNVRDDRFELEVRNLSAGNGEFSGLSNYIVVTAFFDVRIRLLSSSHSPYDRSMRRRREGTQTGVAPSATIAAWSLSEGPDDDNNNKQKGKTTTALIEELGRVTFSQEQDCKHVQALIKKANDLMTSMVSAALKRPDKFIASLYFEEEEDDSVIVDISFSNHNHYRDNQHKEGKEEQFASETDNERSILWNYNNNDALDDNKGNIHSMLAELAADTNRLFYSNHMRKR